jgi:hypothetical protein
MNLFVTQWFVSLTFRVGVSDILHIYPVINAYTSHSFIFMALMCIAVHRKEINSRLWVFNKD